MLTYQVRPRVYRHEPDQELSFPNEVEVVFYLLPLQPFGEEAGGGRTATRAQEATVYFNANSGQHYVESKCPLAPLAVFVEDRGLRMETRGRELHLQMTCDSLKNMDQTLQSLFYALPMLLNLEFADPPFVERVDGHVGDVAFRWELTSWLFAGQITSQETQEERVQTAWRRVAVLEESGNRRVFAALHYFHVACRLCRTGHSPWEFMSEVILNLSKVLETLFPPTPTDAGTIDAARAGLRELGHPEDDIERFFIPAMALRNHIDSAHVDLSLFTTEQLEVLHAYTGTAEGAFREMLNRLVAQTLTGCYTPVQYGKLGRRDEAVKIIDRLAERSAVSDEA